MFLNVTVISKFVQTLPRDRITLPDPLWGHLLYHCAFGSDLSFGCDSVCHQKHHRDLRRV